MFIDHRAIRGQAHVLRLLMVLLLLACRDVLMAQPKYFVLQIPTRAEEQGKHTLAADLFANDTTVARPVVLIQTPYNRKLYRVSISRVDADGSVPYDSARYNYVTVDLRGFFESKDADIAGYDKGLDGYDVVEWIAQQSWCNGKVATWGGSALGLIQFQTARHQPPHLVCCAPFIKDYKTKYSDYYYGGVFRTEQVSTLERLGFITADLILDHQTYDNMWRVAEQITDYPDKFAVPMLMCSGWFDHYPSDVIRAFTDIQANSDAKVRTAHKLIMGPWSHSALGDSVQGELLFPEAAGVPVEAGRRFLDYYMLGAKNGWPLEPAVRSFVMGENAWHSGTTWPVAPLVERTLYLRKDGLLSTTPEPPTMPPLDFPPDTIISDPRNPTPTVGGSRFDPFDPATTVGPFDQRALVESRNDVLVYSTAEMTSPELLVDARAELMVSSDALDTDFSLRLCDVYPDGRSMLLTQGIRRLRFRNGYDKETAYTPGDIVPITIELAPTPILFQTGHKLRIIISSTNAPMFDVNLNNGGAMYTAGDTVTTRNLVHHTSSEMSRLIYRTEYTTSAEHQLEPAAFSMRVWPNPVRDLGRISIETASPADIRIDVFDMLGRCVLSLPVINIDAGQRTIPINLSGLSAGLYLFRARAAHNTALVVGSVVKQ